MRCRTSARSILIKDRLSFMRFLGLGLADPVPDANTIWTFREALTKADAVDGLFRASSKRCARLASWRWAGRSSTRRSWLRPSSATRRGEEGDQGRPHPGGLEGQARQARPEGSRCALDGEVLEGEAARGWSPRVDLAIPAFGYKNHVAIDRGMG